MKTNKKTVNNFLGFAVSAEYKTEVFFDEEEKKEKCKLYTRDSINNEWSIAFVLLDEESAANVGEVLINNYCDSIMQ